MGMTRTPGRGTPRLRAAAVVAVLTLAPFAAACGQGSTAPTTAPTTAPAGDVMESTPPDPTAEPSVLPVPSGLPGGAELPTDPSGADLVLVAGPPGAPQPPVTLTCDWAGGTSSGTHPQAEQACADLLTAIRAGGAFAPVAPDAMCTQQYGGDAVVEVTGAVLATDGAPVDVAATFTLTDGCQIDRFDAMGAVLAPYRGSV